MLEIIRLNHAGPSGGLKATRGRACTPKLPRNEIGTLRKFCAKRFGSAVRLRIAFLLRRTAIAAGVALVWPLPAGSANVAYFAGGCFWYTEAVFEQTLGVTSVVSGYMQGAETIQIAFDPGKTSYDKLLNLFWRAHDPTEVDSQGPDTGKQYRSAIFYADEQQRGAAEKSKSQAQKSFSKPIATEITRAGSFRLAPENQQNFCRKNPSHPYVRQIIEPKLQKLGLQKSSASSR
jgi:peptide-methionine (S)-S-oxide reductase